MFAQGVAAEAVERVDGQHAGEVEAEDQDPLLGGVDLVY